MSNIKYYYKEPGGKTCGPLEWNAILATADAGRVTRRLMISRDGIEPWVRFADVEAFGLAAFQQASAKATPPTAEGLNAAVQLGAQRTGLENALEMVGIAVILLGLIGGLIGLIAIPELTGKMVSLASAASCVVWGMLLMAVSVALTRLREIAGSIRNHKTL